MVQLGAAMSGFALYALFVWMPIWGMASTDSPSMLFYYFVVCALLVFGVFMVSGGRSSFSVAKFVPAFACGAFVSAGVAGWTAWMMVAGLVGAGACYVLMGE